MSSIGPEDFARVFNHGHDGGDGLRAQMVMLSLENSEYFQQDGKIARLLMEHEPVVWRLLLWRDEEHAHQIDETVKVRLVLEESLEVLQGKIESLTQRMGRLQQTRIA